MGQKMITLWTSQVDYLTLTSYDHPDFHKQVLKWAEFEDLFSSKAEKITRMQYSGDNIETDSGSVFYGAGIQGGRGHSLLQISGELSDTAYGGFIGLSKMGACKATRIDLQLTVEQPVGWGQWELFNRCKRQGFTVGWAESKTREGVELATVYIGSRKSERVVRVYQKLTNGGGLLLRFEVEYKGRKARSVLNSMKDHTKSQLLRAEIERINDNGLLSTFLPPLHGIKPHDAKNEAKAESKTNKWLLTQVLPTFERVINSHDGGEVAQEFLRTLINAGKL